MKNRIIKFFALLALVFTITISTPIVTEAQCPMCRMSAESNLKDGGSAGKGLNNGILYMLLTPYALVGIIGYIWYRNRRKEEEGELYDYDYDPINE